MKENRKWSVCSAAILDFPAKQDIVLKNKELCHLVHKTSEQMAFKFLRFLIYISRYEEKSEMVSLYDCNFEFPAKQDIFLKIKELCHLEHKTPEQMPFKILRYII